jgi:hypothetical protein
MVDVQIVVPGEDGEFYKIMQPNRELQYEGELTFISSGFDIENPTGERYHVFLMTDTIIYCTLHEGKYTLKGSIDLSLTPLPQVRDLLCKQGQQN